MGGTGGPSHNYTKAVIQFDDPSATPVPSVNQGAPTFIANPYVPLKTRVMVANRAATALGGRGNLPQFTGWDNRQAMTADTLSSFAPMYQQYANELNAFAQFDPASIQQVLEILNHPRTHDAGLVNELQSVKQGKEIFATLSGALFIQYSRGAINPVFSPSDALQRLNAFGFGTQLRAEMIHIMHNAQFFAGISIDIKDKNIQIIKTDKSGKTSTLVTGSVDADKKLVTLQVKSGIDPADRDDAIKHLLMMVACHAQQNDSNSFSPIFGENIYENIRLLSLAIGEFNLHIPPSALASQQQKIEEQLSKIADPVQQDEARKMWNLWAQRAETFTEKCPIRGIVSVNNHSRPKDSKGSYLNRDNTIKMYREDVANMTFPAPTPKSTLSHP